MEINKTHIASGIVGFMMGGCFCLGAISLVKDYVHQGNSTKDNIQTRIYDANSQQEDCKDLSSYDLTPVNDSGDVVITPTGKKFHTSMSCPALTHSTGIKLVMSSDAEKYGYEACHKCFRP